jgi:hypothetical protein
MTKDEYINLYSSIKTICFVTRHMDNEISIIDQLTKNNSEPLHRANPSSDKKKLPGSYSRERNSSFNGKKAWNRSAILNKSNKNSTIISKNKFSILAE